MNGLRWLPRRICTFRYETDAGTYATLRIYAFSAEGHPLVLGPGDTQLVRPEVAESQ